jgi:hypothetical protein
MAKSFLLLERYYIVQSKKFQWLGCAMRCYFVAGLALYKLSLSQGLYMC